jgi:hypothetical protein
MVMIATAIMAPPIPDAHAADLAVTRPAKARVHAVRHRSRIVRDYDGTPVILRRYVPSYVLAAADFYGAPIIARPAYRTYPVTVQPTVPVPYVTDVLPRLY